MWGIQPGDFWKMTPQEWWWIYDAKIGERRHAGMTEDEIDELLEMLNGSR